MEPVDILHETEVGFLNGLKTNTMDPFGICSEMNIYKKVKEEADDFIELSCEFKAEPAELTGEAEFDSVPWMEQECGDWYKVPVKQEWSETDNVTTLKRRFGCKREPVIILERLSLDKWSHCRPVCFEGGKQLLKQIHGLAYPALGSDTGCTARSSWLSSSEVPVRWGRTSTAGQEIRQDLNESNVKIAVGTDATYNVQVQRLESGVHLSIHGTECQQKNLLASSQVADEAAVACMDDAVHSESSRSSVMDSMKCQTAGIPYPSFVVDADKSYLTKHAGHTTKTLNEISTVFSDDCYAGKTVFKCSVCQRTLSNKSALNRHKKIHTGEKPFECGACRKQFTRKSDLTVHKRIHSGEKPFECNVCRKKFTKKSYLPLHTRVHAGKKPFECSVCRKIFALKSVLKKHVRSHTHTGEKTHECHVCRKKFAYKSHLTSHVRFHTGEKTFECGVCKKTFAHKRHLTSHARTHTGENICECSVCGKKFAGKSELNRHVRSHTGEKLFECGVCRKKFTTKSYLTSHLRIHTGEKPFECSICRKKFAQKSTLTLHVRIHTGEKPFECSVCRKKFAQKSPLTKHVRIHTGEKPFECSVCRKKFAQKSTLTLHVKIHTGEKPFECGVCRKKFPGKSHLNSHVRIHHQ